MNKVYVYNNWCWRAMTFNLFSVDLFSGSTNRRICGYTHSSETIFSVVHLYVLGLLNSKDEQSLAFSKVKFLFLIELWLYLPDVKVKAPMIEGSPKITSVTVWSFDKFSMELTWIDTSARAGYSFN